MVKPFLGASKATRVTSVKIFIFFISIFFIEIYIHPQWCGVYATKYIFVDFTFDSFDGGYKWLYYAPYPVKGTFVQPLTYL